MPNSLKESHCIIQLNNAARQAEIKSFKDFAAFAGDVDGSVTASLPVMGSKYFL